MLIRSQCGMILTDNLDLEAYLNEMTGKWVISNGAFKELGVYRDADDARKVLDYIENAYILREPVYTMPKKEEV